MARHVWLVAIVLSAYLFVECSCTPDPTTAVVAPSEPRSAPVSHSSQLPSSKFTEQEAMNIEDVVFGTDSAGFQKTNKCPIDIGLVWSNTMNTGIYSTGVIEHLYSDLSLGKQVIIPGFHRDLNILDRDGHHVPGSPINMASEVYFHSSPQLIDFNNDGKKDIVWVNVDAEIYILNGDPLAEVAVLDFPWKLPKIKLNKHWYESVAPVTKDSNTASSAAGRKLMSVNQLPEPLARMRHEKRKTYAIKRLVRKLKTIAAAQQPIRAPARKLLQVDAAATPISTPAAASNPTPTATTPSVAHEEEHDELAEADHEDAKGEEEEDASVPIDPVGSAADVAQSHLDRLKAKYREGHGLDAEIKSTVADEESAYMKEVGLELPEEGVNVDDQEQSEEEEEADADHHEEEGADDEEYTDVAFGDQPNADINAHSGPTATDPAQTADPGNVMSEYSSTQIQQAVDELLAEDPSFADTLKEFGVEGEDGEYAEAVKQLAARYEAERTEIRARQEAAGVTQPPVEVDPAVMATKNPEHIASKTAQLLAEAQADAKKHDDLNSNVVRILGDKKPTIAGTPVHLESLDEVAGFDSQVADGLPEEARESLNLFSDVNSDHLDEYDPEVAWELAELDREYPVEKETVWVDAHVLASPVLVDITGDQKPELLLSVSYFFDDTDYLNNPSKLKRLGPDVNIRKYVAGGLVAVDLWTHAVVWNEHLDLSTDDVELKAHIYSSPTVVDLDGDGHLEIIVATSLGFIYVFDASTRQLLRGFPLTMHEIQAQVATADLNNDGVLEMVAMDSKGNVMCFDKTGKELWSTLISGFSSQAATFGDVNGDGAIDVVVGTVSGHIWALHGATGKLLPHFPLRTDGRIISPITLVNLFSFGQFSPMAHRGLHLVFPSFDGHVYVVDGRSGCTNKLDIGEHSYGMVLVDDILGRGKLDLLVTTMNGNVFCFSTEANSDMSPLKSWSSQTQGLNGFTVRDAYHGVYFTRSCKDSHRDISGADFEVEYVIVDERPKTKPSATLAANASKARYQVSFRFAGRVVNTVEHSAPGLYSFKLRADSIPQYTTIEIVMVNEHRQMFKDEFVSGMNVHFYKSIKYMIVIPFLVMIAMMMMMKGDSNL